MLEQHQKSKWKSLGGKFLSVEQSEDMETVGGYAKEAQKIIKKSKPS